MSIFLRCLIYGGTLSVFALSTSIFAQEKSGGRFDGLLTPPPGQTLVAPDGDLLIENGQAITTVESWEKKRDSLQKAWIRYLGPMASIRETGKVYPAPEIEVLEEVKLDGIIRRKIRFTTEAGQKSRAYLLLPENIESPRPAVIVFHGTNAHSYQQTSGVHEVNNRATGYHLAKRGYVTLCPQCFLWPEGDDVQLVYREESENFRKRQPENRGMARMILDAQIAVDILVSLKEVDPARIGCTGHSLGGKQALYLPAFDRRVACSVSSEGGVGIEQSNWEAEWYLGAEAKKADFPRHHREIVALIAPRPFLVLGGDASDGAATWPYIAAAVPVYRLYGEPIRLGLFNHGQGHSLPPEAEKMTYEWFDMHLGGRSREEKE